MAEASWQALGLIEVDSVGAGMVVGDAMVTNAPVAFVRAGTVQPGHFLILVRGEEASVGVAVERGRTVGGADIIDSLLLSQVNGQVLERLDADAVRPEQDAVGVIETASASSALRGADAGCKGANVTLALLRLCDGLGGRGLAIFSGDQTHVEAALDLATAAAEGPNCRVVSRVVPSMHPEMLATLTSKLCFNDV